MIGTAHRINQTESYWASLILVAGVVGVAWQNWRRWQRDKALLDRRPDPEFVPPLDRWPSMPRVSVLVAAWNEAKHIDRHVQSFLALRYPNKELILCAGGTDGTYSLACRWLGPRVTVLEQRTGEGKQRSLQRCLRHSNGTLIYLTDADCVLNSDAIERVLYPVAIGRELVSTGVSRPLACQMRNPFVRNQWVPSRYTEILATAEYADGLLGRNSVLTREIVEQAWSGNDDVPSGTDYYLALRVRRAGCRIRRVPDSSVETAFPECLAAYVRQRTRWLRNLLVLGYQFQDERHIRHAQRTSLVGLTLLAMPILPLFAGRIGLASWIVGWAAVVASRSRYLAVVNRFDGTPNDCALALALAKVMIGDFVAWTRAPLDALTRRGRERW